MVDAQRRFHCCHWHCPISDSHQGIKLLFLPISHSSLPKVRNKTMGRIVKGELKRTSLTKERRKTTRRKSSDHVFSVGKEEIQEILQYPTQEKQHAKVLNSLLIYAALLVWGTVLLSSFLLFVLLWNSCLKPFNSADCCPKSNVRDWLLNKTGVCFVYRLFYTTLICLIIIVAWTFYQTPNNAC